MELYREDVIPGHRTGKGESVLAFPGCEVFFLRPEEISVAEVEAIRVANPPPDGVTRRLADAIPAHMRHLERPVRRLMQGLWRKVHHLPPENAEARGVALGAPLEQHL